MRIGNGFHLGYCTNIHPGESWEEVYAALSIALPRVRAEVQCAGPMAVGLRLSHLAAEQLEQADTLGEFKRFLQNGNYYIPTINGFPYGSFHGRRVKEQVYLPDWRSQARLEYSNRLARLLAALIEPSQTATGTVSTVPGAFRSSISDTNDVRAIAVNFLCHAAYLAELRARTGVVVTLGIEPEPACLMETTSEAVDFFRNHLFDLDLIAQAARQSGRRLGFEDVQRHLGLCLDACHLAVQFESPVEALAQLHQAGIQVCKVQVSSALRLDQVDGHSLSHLLGKFADDTYLHQVVEHAGASQEAFTDLPLALDAAARVPNARRTWRVHFHVPIFLASMGVLETTQSDLIELLKALRQAPVCQVLEVETYTWEVLPSEYRTTDVYAAIARELIWTRTQLES